MTKLNFLFAPLIRLLYILYSGLLSSWAIYDANLGNYSPFPIILLQIGPLLIFAYGVIYLHRRSLIYLSFMLLLYFCFSSINLFSTGMGFYSALAETITLGFLFSSILMYLRSTRNSKEKID